MIYINIKYTYTVIPYIPTCAAVYLVCFCTSDKQHYMLLLFCYYIA